MYINMSHRFPMFFLGNCWSHPMERWPGPRVGPPGCGTSLGPFHRAAAAGGRGRRRRRGAGGGTDGAWKTWIWRKWLVGFQDVNSIFLFFFRDFGWIQDVSNFCSDSCLMCFCYFPWLEWEWWWWWWFVMMVMMVMMMMIPLDEW